MNKSPRLDDYTGLQKHSSKKWEWTNLEPNEVAVANFNKSVSDDGLPPNVAEFATRLEALQLLEAARLTVTSKKSVG